MKEIKLEENILHFGLKSLVFYLSLIPNKNCSLITLDITKTCQHYFFNATCVLIKCRVLHFFGHSAW